MTLKAAVFLDRDGVLNRNVLNPSTGEYESPGVPDDFELVPGALPALQKLQSAGFPLFLISNQPNYAKGKNSLEELAAVHARLKDALEANHIEFVEYYYCLHHPKGIVDSHSGPCECRKPSPYFLKKAASDHNIALEGSWIVGDRVTDIECGRAAGLRTIRVEEDHPAHRLPDELQADYEARDLSHAVEIIVANSVT